MSINCHLRDIDEGLTQIVLGKRDETAESRNNISKGKFQSLFLTVLLSKMLDLINCISELWQSPEIGLRKTEELLQILSIIHKML